MARIRSIKPEFPHSESMGRVSRDSRLCFIEMWTIADDSGRLRGNSRMLASLLFPYDDDAPALMDGWLDELVRENCIKRYEAEGQKYIQILNWLNHQKIDKPSASKIPAFAEPSRKVAKPREPSSEEWKGREGIKGEEGKGKEGNGGSPIPSGIVGPESKAEPPTAKTWAAYAQAYCARYGTQPVRNASVNGQLAQLVGRLGADDAPQVAAFYVGHQKAYYVSKSHPVSVLLADCEGLRTQWATGRKVLTKDAQEADRLAADGGMWGRVAGKFRETEAVNG